MMRWVAAVYVQGCSMLVFPRPSFAPPRLLFWERSALLAAFPCLIPNELKVAPHALRCLAHSRRAVASVARWANIVVLAKL